MLNNNKGKVIAFEENENPENKEELIKAGVSEIWKNSELIQVYIHFLCFYYRTFKNSLIMKNNNNNK